MDRLADGLFDQLMDPLPVDKPYGKDDAADTPVAEHADPYAHGTDMSHSYKEDGQGYTAQPHGKGRRDHREPHITGSPHGICGYN